jgi:c-di-GMP-related signal transduction protein
MYSYVARQPILDSNLQVVAYELLFRDGEDNCFPGIDPDQATSNILTDNHLTLGLGEITGGKVSYLNFHTGTLVTNFPDFLDPKKVVIEILEDVKVDEALLDAVKAIKAKGYTLALDDFDFDPKWQPFYPYIDIIKVDVLQFSIIEISKFVNTILHLKVILLAEKVESSKNFEQLKMLGFTLFQGYFFARPEMMKQKKITTTKNSVLALISLASKSSLDFDVMSDIFKGDTGLTYKLLRFINNPTFGHRQEITSLKHALIYIGDIELKKFLALLALSDLGEGKPSEIMRLSLVRAKFCEQISAIKNDSENPPKAFLTGMLSLIDGLLDHKIETVLEILPIHKEIKAALLNEKNYLYFYLTLAKKMEQGYWKSSEKIAIDLGLSTDNCFQAHQNALAWSDEVLSY